MATERYENTAGEYVEISSKGIFDGRMIQAPIRSKKAREAYIRILLIAGYKRV